MPVPVGTHSESLGTPPLPIKHHEPSCPPPRQPPGTLGQRNPRTGLDAGRVADEASACQPAWGPSGTPAASQEGDTEWARSPAEEGRGRGASGSVLLVKPWACQPRPCSLGLSTRPRPHPSSTLLLR